MYVIKRVDLDGKEPTKIHKVFGSHLTAKLALDALRDKEPRVRGSPIVHGVAWVEEEAK